MNKVSQFALMLFSAICMWSLSSCVGDDSDFSDLQGKTLKGTIAGDTTWVYGSANAYLFSSDQRYRARFLSSEETASDPCTVPTPTIEHVSATFKPFVGSYFVTPIAVEDNQVQVSISASATENVVATSGFMEVYAIENLRIYGYLQAVLDSDNRVEGSFEIRICN